MKRAWWSGWLLSAFLTPAAAEQVPGCEGLPLADCLGMPPVGMEFPDRDPVVQPLLERPRELDDRRWRRRSSPRWTSMSRAG